MKVLPKTFMIIGLILLAAVLGSFGYYWLTEENLYVPVYLFVICLSFIGAVVVYFRAVGPKLIKLLEDRETLESERNDLKDKQSACSDLQWRLVQKEHELERRENYLRDEIRLDLTKKLVPEVKEELSKKLKKEVNKEVRAAKRHMLDRNARLNLAQRLLVKSRVRILELRAARSQLLSDLQKSEGDNRDLAGQVKHLSMIVEQRKNWDNETAMKMIPHLVQSTLLKALHRRKDFADLKAKLRSGR